MMISASMSEPSPGSPGRCPGLSCLGPFGAVEERNTKTCASGLSIPARCNRPLPKPGHPALRERRPGGYLDLAAAVFSALAFLVAALAAFRSALAAAFASVAATLVVNRSLSRTDLPERSRR